MDSFSATFRRTLDDLARQNTDVTSWICYNDANCRLMYDVRELVCLIVGSSGPDQLRAPSLQQIIGCHRGHATTFVPEGCPEGPRIMPIASANPSQCPHEQVRGKAEPQGAHSIRLGLVCWRFCAYKAGMLLPQSSTRHHMPEKHADDDHSEHPPARYAIQSMTVHYSEHADSHRRNLRSPR